MIGALMARKFARGGFEAVNRHDLETLMDAWADDAVFEFPGNSIMSGRMQGKPAIRKWFERWWDRFPSTLFTLDAISVDNILALGATNRVLVEWRLEETDQEGRTFRLSGVTRLQAERGKLMRVRDYIFDQDVVAEAWKGSEETRS